MPTLRLIPMDRNGEPVEPIADLPEVVQGFAGAYRHLYGEVGFSPPWTGYYAVDGGQFIGCCGYKSPPANGRVEIAYFTMPPLEGRRYATTMAEQLIQVAAAADPSVVVFAQTLPNENASTTILKRLGFELLGTVEHPEDGPVWEWQQRKSQ